MPDHIDRYLNSDLPDIDGSEALGEVVTPFNSSTDWADWVYRNCKGCARWHEDTAKSCDMEMALGVAMVGTGYVTPAIAERMGDGEMCRERVRA